MRPVDPAPTRLTSRDYFALVDRGELRPDDRVELLEGVIVAMSPQNTPHSAAIGRLTHVIPPLVAARAVVRIQLPFLAGRYNVPEPDVAVVPGAPADYDGRHPDRAFFIVEVADSSLPTDRLSKARIYAAAAVPQYLVVNLPHDCVEVFEAPQPAAACYAGHRRAARGERIALHGFGDAAIAVDDVLPGRRRSGRPPRRTSP